jgi:hypothetical protein
MKNDKIILNASFVGGKKTKKRKFGGPAKK